MMGVCAKRSAAKLPAALSVLAALAAAAFAISGCGASATLDPVARAAQVTSKQGGARFSMDMRFSSSLLPSGLAIRASGYIDQRQHSGQMTMDLSGIPGAGSLPGGGGTVQLIFQYPVIYMNTSTLAGQLPAGKTWMKLDVSKAAQAAGIDTSQFSSLNQTDPTQFLDYLRGSSGKVATVGGESLRGVPTTHYRADLELSRILDKLPSSQRAAAKGGLEKLGAANTIPVDVWVDRQDRLRRMQMSFGTAPAGAVTGTAGAAPTFTGTITIDLTSYGRVPAIVPPPANQVFDASGLTGAGLTKTGH